MSNIEQDLKDAIKAKDPKPVSKRAERKKEEKKTTKPKTTQKGKVRTTKAAQSLKLFQERQIRVVDRLPRTKAEQNLLKASTKQLMSIAKSLKLEGLSNLRKADLVILILNKWKGTV